MHGGCHAPFGLCHTICCALEGTRQYGMCRAGVLLPQALLHKGRPCQPCPIVWPCKAVVWFLHGMCGDTAVCVVTQMCEEQHHVCEERLALFPRLDDFWLLPAPA